jgi:hypothetical protein
MANTQIRGTTQIQGLTIVDAQVATAAAIALTKLAKMPVTPDGATPFTAPQSMGSQKLTSLADPTAATDAATKNYVDNVAQGLAPKQSVRALATANITLSGTQTVDGVALSAGDTVLCIAQTTGSQNGSYTVAAGAWTRTPDFADPNDAVRSPYWFVGEGTANAGSGWVMTTPLPYTIGTTALAFTQFTGAGEVIAGNGLQKSGNTLSINTAVTVDLSTAQTLSNKSIAATQLTGTLPAAQFPALTGDVTNTAGSLATTIAPAAVTLAKMATLPANTVIGNITGSTATPTAVSTVSSPTPSTVMIRDASANIQVNNVVENLTATPTSAGTLTLTAASSGIQQFTGSTTHTMVMPNATTLPVGTSYQVLNRSSGAVAVQASGGGLLQSMAGNSIMFMFLTNNSTAAGVWDLTYIPPAGGGGTVTSVSVVTANGFGGTVATATSTPAITISTGVTGLLKGNGTAVAAALASTDFMAPGSFVNRETPTGTINGVNATFTLANTPLVNTEQVFLNGLLLEPGAGNDYTISGATITMLIVPATGDRLKVCYQK